MQLFSSIINFFNKIINRLFGKTWIFIAILAWFLIITGIVMLLRTEKARKSMAGQGFGIVKGYLFILALCIFALLASVTNKLNGLFAFLLFIFGIVLLVKAYRALKKKAANKINVLVEKVSEKYLKMYAIAQIIIGILMLAFHRRVWF